MMQKLSKSELVDLVAKLLGAEGSEEETLRWLELVEQSVSDPNVQGLIYWPNRYGLSGEPSAEEIVERALNYQPIAL